VIAEPPSEAGSVHRTVTLNLLFVCVGLGAGAGSVIGVAATAEDQELNIPSELALTLNVYSVPPCKPLTTT
jgi:hypothetical protein